MPEEVLALLIVISIMAFVLTLTRSSQKYRLKKLEQESGRTGDSLTTSELRDMIEAAVSDATEPLRDDLESLAARMDDIESGPKSVVLEVENDVQEKTVGRAVRQRQR